MSNHFRCACSCIWGTGEVTSRCEPTDAVFSVEMLVDSGNVFSSTAGVACWLGVGLIFGVARRFFFNVLGRFGLFVIAVLRCPKDTLAIGKQDFSSSRLSPQFRPKHH